MEEHECGYLTSDAVPQGHGPDGKPLWYCRCRKFRTNEFDELRRHIDGIDDNEDDLLVLGMIAGIGISAAAISYYLNMNWKLIGSTSANVFLIPFVLNKYLNYRRNQRSIANAPKTKTVNAEYEKIKQDLDNKIAERAVIKEKRRQEHIEFIESHAFDYDPKSASCLARFRPIMKNSECTFAKSSHIWGSADYIPDLSIEENVYRSVKALRYALQIGRESRLDGFVFEISGKEFGDTVEKFGDTVRRVLSAVSDCDPECDHPMDSEIIDRRGWRYIFDGVGIFVTCFGPCYPESHARYHWGSDQSVFVLFQPQYSFSFHNIGEDHVWDDTKTTARQKIRQAFKNAGREYMVPKARFYPGAPMIVPPLKIEEPLLNWYTSPADRKKAHDGEMLV